MPTDVPETILGQFAVTDGLTGMSEALAAMYPMATLRTCIVQ